MSKPYLNPGVDLSPEWNELRKTYKRHDTRAHHIRVFEMALSPCLGKTLNNRQDYKDLLKKHPLPDDRASLSYEAFRAYVLAFEMIMREEGTIFIGNGPGADDDPDMLAEFFGPGGEL